MHMQKYIWPDPCQRSKQVCRHCRHWSNDLTPASFGAPPPHALTCSASVSTATPSLPMLCPLSTRCVRQELACKPGAKLATPRALKDHRGPGPPRPTPRLMVLALTWEAGGGGHALASSWRGGDNNKHESWHAAAPFQSLCHLTHTHTHTTG